MKEVKSIFWDSVSLFLGKGVFILLSFASIALTTRILGVEGYGRLALFIAIVQLFFTFAASWLQPPIVRYGRQELIESNKINLIFWNTMLLALPFLAIGMVCIEVFKNRIAAYIGIPPAYIWLVAAYLIVTIAVNFAYSILKAIGKLKAYATSEVAEKALVVLGLGLIMLGGFAPSVPNVIFAYAFSGLIIAVPAFFFLAPQCLFPVQIDKGTLKKVFYFSFPLAFSMAGAYFFNWADVMIIKKFMDMNSVGTYSLAHNGAMILQQLAMLTTVVSIPLIVSFLANERKDLIERYFHRSVAQGVFLWAAFLIFIMMTSRIVVPLIAGRKFLPAAFPLSGLIVGLSATGLASLYTPVIQTYELTKQVAMGHFITAVVNIFLNFSLIPLMGIGGAIIANVLSLYVGVIARIFIIRKYLGLLNLKPLIVSASVFLAFALFYYLPKRWTFPVGLPLMLAVLYAMAKLLNLFDEEDCVLFEYIHMPLFVKNGLKRIWVFLA